ALPWSWFDGESSSQQRATAIAALIDTHHCPCQTSHKRRALRHNAKTCFKLSSRFVRFIHTQKHETVPQSCAGIVRDDSYGVFVKRQRILPEVIVADAKKHRDRHGPACDKP